jgi:antitoxin YefM
MENLRNKAEGRNVIQVRPRTPVTIIQVMTTISLTDAKIRLSAILDDLRDTHKRVVITRNGRPEAVLLSVSDLEVLEETLDLLSIPGGLEEIRAAETEIARGEAIGADELRRLVGQRTRVEQERRVSSGETKIPPAMVSLPVGSGV